MRCVTLGPSVSPGKWPDRSFESFKSFDRQSRCCIDNACVDENLQFREVAESLCCRRYIRNGPEASSRAFIPLRATNPVKINLANTPRRASFAQVQRCCDRSRRRRTKKLRMEVESNRLLARIIREDKQKPAIQQEHSIELTCPVDSSSVLAARHRWTLPQMRTQAARPLLAAGPRSPVSPSTGTWRSPAAGEQQGKYLRGVGQKGMDLGEKLDCRSMLLQIYSTGCKGSV